MPAIDPYNDEVRRHFENPVHAGEPDPDYPDTWKGEAVESRHGARIALTAGVERGKLAALRFRVWGCPHLIAAAESVCSDLEGGPVGKLASVSANELMARLSVPVEKTGRMLLVEDAARQLLAGINATD